MRSDKVIAIITRT